MNKKFDKEWWFSFVKENHSFTETKVFHNVLSEILVAKLRDGVIEMVKSRINKQYFYQGLRVFVKGEQIADTKVRTLLKSNKFTSKDTIEGYFKRVFGNNFGVIVNSCESYSEILAENVLKSVKPLFEIIGIPPWGLELTTFIGNYGWTPLGIHTDERGENVLHYHLGPGQKTMYTWDDDVYKDKGNGIINNMNIKPLLKYANEYKFGTGDLYYMPWNKHHIGNTEEFSIGVTLWFNNPTKYSFAKLMIDAIKRLYLKKDDTIIESQLDYLDNENTLFDFISTFNVKKETLEKSLESFLTDTYNDFKKCLLSNGGWKSTPINIYEKKTLDKMFPYLEKKEIVLNPVSKIIVEKSDNRLQLYVRGAKLSFKYFSELDNIVKQINIGESVSVQSILTENKSIPENVIIYFLKLLLNNNGIILNKVETK